MQTNLKTIYLVHHSHTDIGFTHEQPVVMDLHAQFIDQAVDHCERTADRPLGSALKWTCEAAGVVQHWLRTRSDKQIQRFLNLEKRGLIEVTGMFAVMSQCLGPEAAYRQFYPIDRLRRDYGMRIDSVLQCDINGLSWGMVEAMLDCGIENFGMAINENVGRAAFNRQRPNAFHWQGAGGRKILTWNGLHYNSNNYFGFPGDQGAVSRGEKTDWNGAVRKLPGFLEWLNRRGYSYPFTMFQPTATTFTDNGPVDPTLSDFVRWWNEQGHTPRMEIVTLREFFAALRRLPAKLLPTHRGEWTDYWNIGAASTAYETSLNRRTYHRLYETEAVLALGDHDAARARQRDLDQAWENAWWYDEHTWGANTSIVQPFRQPARSQLNQKLNFAYRARSFAQLTRLEAIDRLARSVKGGNEGYYILAVNSLPWAREERLQFPASWLHSNAATTVSHVQYLDRREGTEQTGLGDQAMVVTQPIKVPAMGYRLLRAGELSAEPTKGAPSRTSKLAKAENRWFRIELDAKRGGVKSMYDKARRREWADRKSEHALGGFVYEYPRTTKSTLDRYGGRMQIFRESDWSKFMTYGGWNTDWPAVRKGITKVVEQRVTTLPRQVVLSQRCSAPGVAGVTYEVTLGDDAPYVDLAVTIDKLWDTSPDACYIAFPFSLDRAQPRYQTVHGIVQPHLDQLPDCNQDYHTAQQWADLSNDTRGVTVTTLDAPLVMFGGFNVAQMFDKPRSRIRPLLISLPMTNYYHCNYAGGQLGAVTFHYRLYPHGPFDAAESSRLAREAASPLISHPVMNPVGIRPSQASLLRLSNSAIIPLTVKPAARGDGLVLRLCNTLERRCRTTVDFPSHTLTKAWRCDGLENPKSVVAVVKGSLTLDLKGNETVTCRVKLQDRGVTNGKSA